MKTSKKLFYFFGGSSLLIITAAGIIMYSYVKSTVIKLQESRLEESAGLIIKKISAITDVSIRNSLRSTAHKTEQLVRYYHSQKEAGSISEKEAISVIRKLILSKQYAPVGETGYLAVVKDNGLLYIHPHAEGASITKAVFWPKVEAILSTPEKEGYLEYEWKNPGENEPRTKAAYLTYFEPWKMIIWVSSYKAEFNTLISKDDFREGMMERNEKSSRYSYILDLAGNLIVHPEIEGSNVSGFSFAREMIEKKQGRIEYLWKGKYDNREKKKTAYYGFLSDLNWIVVSGLNESELLSPLIFLKFFIFAGMLIALFVFALSSKFVGRLIEKKIEAFMHLFKAAGEGNLTHEYIAESTPAMRDEIDDMGTVFNVFMRDYRDVLFGLQKITNKIIELIQALSASSQETSSTANQQAAAVKEIVSTMEDVNSLSKSIEKKISEVTVITDNTKTIVSNGFSKVTASLDKMSEINSANQTTIDGIRYLSEKIDNIWDIVNLINGIADQTKIIAFNAELEASAAGEAGKNFQIVATEIRRLADGTVRSTNEIKERITEIQQSSDRLILTSEEGTEKIRQGNDLTKEINELFKTISGSAEISNESTQSISKSIRQQGGTFEQILIAIRQISEGVDNIAAATSETAGAADSLGEVSENLEKIVSRYVLEAPAGSGENPSEART